MKPLRSSCNFVSYTRIALTGLSLLLAASARLSAQGETVVQTVNVGAKVSFQASAQGNPAPTFQWRKNGDPIAGATNDTLSLYAVTIADSATYTVVATNEFGFAVSPDAVLHVSEVPPAAVAPVFTLHPVSVTAPEMSTITLSASASGSPSPTIQWFKNGVTLPGRTGTTLTLPSITTNDSGTYAAVATNSAGSVTSNPATVTIKSEPKTIAPVFTLHPVSQTVSSNESVTFTAAATGTPAPSFQWYKDGAKISGATSTTLALRNVGTGDSGKYCVTATNSAGNATCNTATLTVSALPSGSAPPVFTVFPQSQTVSQKSNVTFTASASGTPAPTYQWKKDGAVISGATGSSLTISNVQKPSAGSYTVAATNVVGSATSPAAVLTLQEDGTRVRGNSK